MDVSIHKAERQERRGRRFVSFAILAALVIISSSWFGLFAYLGANAAYGTVHDLENEYLPDEDQAQLALSDLSRLSEVYTADEVLLGELTERNSQPVLFEEIPELVVNAVLAAEDADYWEHPGYDFWAILRALWNNATGGATTQGGSTITQQVVKQNFVGSEPTLLRKAHELVYSVALENRYSKEQILEYYLNSVYFGSNAYGIKAAAQEYFGKDLDELTIAEAAALAVPIRNPTLYDLRSDSDTPLRARNRVIDEMVDEGFITAEEGDAAKREPLETVPHREFEQLAPLVLIAAKDEVLNDPQYGLGDSYLERKRSLFGCPAGDTECEGGGGLRIYTTVDYSLQVQAQDLLQSWFPPGENGPTGAIAMVDNETGGTIVMASGLEFGEDIEAGQRTYDIATKGRRNPGSAFKVFGLVAALEQGITLNSWWWDQTPQELEVPGSPDWDCRGGLTNGSIRTLERGLIASTNVVFCQLSLEVGPANIAEVAHRMGIQSPLGAVPAIVLGAQAVTPLEMASAFSTLANYGERVDNYLIERIEDADGNVIYQHQTVRTQVLDPALSAAVVNTMEKVVTSGTGTSAWIDRPQAGKTGTHENHTDAWYIGFIPQYTTSVWVGFPDSQVEMRNLVINGVYHERAWGGSVAAPIWRDFMNIVTEDLPVLDFPEDPEGTSLYYQTPSVEVPDVIGMELEEATEEIYKAGFFFDVEYVNSDEPRDQVVGQDPEAPLRHRQGTAIALEVSNGLSPTTEMLDIVGMNSAGAVSALQDLRDETGIEFSWELEPQTVDDPAQDNQIISTNPAAGRQITKETVIIVHYGVYEEP
jgi:membrane peptidoglycan carboxypeptidase